MPEEMEGSVQGADIDIRALGWGAMAIVVMICLVSAAAWLAWRHWGATAGRAVPPADVAGPVLESAPQPARATYLAEKQRLLDSWQWIDRRAGIARIPVEQAMRILAERDAAKAGRKP